MQNVKNKNKEFKNGNINSEIEQLTKSQIEEGIKGNNPTKNRKEKASENIFEKDNNFKECIYKKEKEYENNSNK